MCNYEMIILITFFLQVSTYRLPKDPDERQRWIKAIPRDNIPDREDTVVFANHFPVNFEVVKVKGRERPKNPPRIFDNLPKSLIPTPLSLKRKTTKASSSTRSLKEDELGAFLEQDKINSFGSICASISADKIGETAIHYICGDKLYIQSKELENNTGIAKFVLCIFNNLNFEVYHAGVRCNVPSLSKNRVFNINSWSQITEILRHLEHLT